jgi:hypothetical protein
MALANAWKTLVALRRSDIVLDVERRPELVASRRLNDYRTRALLANQTPKYTLQ